MVINKVVWLCIPDVGSIIRHGMRGVSGGRVCKWDDTL
jgi:hypothetical protein